MLLKLAWRNLKSQRLFSIIKIGGFAFSIAVCLLIVLFIRHESSYDKFYPEGDQVYRLMGHFKTEKGIESGIQMPAPLAGVLKDTYDEVEIAGRLLGTPLFGAGNNQVSTSENPENTSQDGFVYIDQSLFDMMPLKTIYGSLAHALDKPNSIVITKENAEKLFVGDPIGKTIRLNNDKNRTYEITAVLEEVPSNSHLYGYSYFMTLSGINFYDGEQQRWTASNYSTYIKLKPGANIEKLGKLFTKTYLQDYLIPQLRAEGQTINPVLNNAFLNLQAIKDIHLHSKNVHDGQVEVKGRGDYRIVRIFAGIACFILLIASINFINLSTANAASRAKEVGIRKTVGGSRRSLMYQFILESIMYSVISVIFAVIIAFLLLPSFNHLANKSLSIPWEDAPFLLGILATGVLVGLLSGIYPAIFLSSFKPIAALKGKMLSANTSNLFRNGLVVFQFATSILLIISTLIINRQMDFILNKDVGFDKEHVLMLHGTNTLDQQVKPFKEEIKKLSAVSSVSISDYIPVEMNGSRRNGNPFWLDGKQNETKSIGGQAWIIDEDYIQTYGLHLALGRNLNPNISGDSSSVIVNQKFVKDLGIKYPIGAKIFNGQTFTIVGVVEDFFSDSMRGEAVRPVCMGLGMSPSVIAIKLNSEDMRNSLSEINKIWDKFSPQQKIQYSFLDEDFAGLYADVWNTQNILSVFALVAVFIACLGLFGLAAYITQQRTKEIGIRKVLGASISGIISLLTIDFVKLVLIAIVIAVPIGWWAMNAWLEDFNYRIDIPWWIFVVAALISLLIAYATIGYHTFKTARLNPVSSLRDE